MIAAIDPIEKLEIEKKEKKKRWPIKLGLVMSHDWFLIGPVVSLGQMGLVRVYAKWAFCE